MNKKQLIVASLAALLSVSSANAVSTITDVASGTSGTFNIKPAQINGDVGYRYYDDFSLGQGDVANLIYQGLKNGETRDIETFINLVKNGVDVQGVLNTIRNDAFYNGHAVFISPKGMVVGASGVLNVGTLSVLTPTETSFDKLKTDYGKADFTVINNISAMRNNTSVNNNNYGGNAKVQIQGKVLARNGVDIRGSQVDVSGQIVNGYNGSNVFSTATDAATLFANLVNTDGSIKAGSSLIADDAGRIVIKSGADVDSSNASGISVSGNIVNLGNTETAITNHGSNGLQVSGTVVSNGKLNVYNNNTASALTVSGNLTSGKDSLSVTNKGANLEVTSTGVLKAAENIEVVNNGKASASQLKFAGKAYSTGKTDIVNRGATGASITGTIGDSTSQPTSIRIINENGKLAFSGSANAKESVSFRNNTSGTGMEIGGTVQAGEGVLVHNEKGAATLKGTITVTKGNVAVMNEGTGKLTTESGSSITNGNGKLAIKNTSTGGMELNGKISNTGEIAINNLAGAAAVNGTITNTGNIGIINKDKGTGLTIGGTINNTGKIKLVNSTGANGLTVNGTVNNAGTGNLYVYNDAGHTTINGTLNNTKSGDLYVLSRNTSTGITTGADSKIANETGNLAIKHNGSGSKDGAGMNLNGTVTNNGEIAINNYTGDMNVAGTITQKGTATIGIINRSATENIKTGATTDKRKGGDAMTVNATITGHDINIKNNGTGDMTVNGEITHDGRLNILGNEGTLTLGGKIHNTGVAESAVDTDHWTYAVSRANGDGIVVTEDFSADSTNGGTILIKNITGANGLNYAGTMSTTNGGQAQVYNKVGDMTVTGAINATPAVVLNTGNKLTVTDAADLQGDIKIINTGSVNATVSSKYKNYFREKLSN